MIIQEFEQLMVDIFGREKLELVPEESGLTYRGRDEIKRIGYATNLTPDTVAEAIQHGVDLMITHHDAWEFVFGMKERCLEMLQEHQISHYFAHLPLDDADFGTGATLLNQLGLQLVKNSHLEEGYHCGWIGEYKEGVAFEELVQRVETLCDEPVKAWQNNDRLIKRVGIVSGGGGLTPDVKEAVEEECDLYLTGEKILYTIQYAKVAGINLLVGSHTFTEVFGVESWAKKISEAYPDVEMVQLAEEHVE